MTLNLNAGFDTLNFHPPLEVMHLPAGDVWIQRDDLIHPVISGNKWRKLVGHLAEMSAQGKHILVTYGGAYSNHLVATAVAAELSGVRCIGILRGDEPFDNHYLRVARNAGMEVISSLPETAGTSMPLSSLRMAIVPPVNKILIFFIIRNNVFKMD